ncbi:MAG: alkaline phosphatase family protein [Acidobacteriaceae bacterium]|nr:alkaline phosphatase family protein [Acidobacteriaceae bacterium]
MNSRRVLTALAATCCLLATSGTAIPQDLPDSDDFPTTTPIKHVVVIFQENISFDHYFGTYPNAQPNKDGTRFFLRPQAGTPRVDNLLSAGLLVSNPNLANPFRIDRSVPNTCDQNHDYGAEQAAFHGGLMDQFIQQTGCTDPVLGPNSVMGYYDGNTVTALWNYAQHFAMSDNYFGTTFGPSTPGALNVVAGTTYAGTVKKGSAAGDIADGLTTGSVIGDPDPYGDVCSNPKRTQIRMSGRNVGDLLNDAGITWGSFMGGFADCKKQSTGVTGLTSTDYIPHHAWFQYWASTQNPNHVRPSSPLKIGTSEDGANHEYDLAEFWTAVKLHRIPAVSYIKAAAYQDGHAGYSDPLDEQIFLADFINRLQRTDEWKETAVFITYDDSDGWYDHVMGPIINQSDVKDDQLLGPGNCGTPKSPAGSDAPIQNGRCGYGPRLPLLVVSPWARQNYVDHRVTDQSSIVRFIEENFNLGRIGNGSADVVAGTLNGLFDFRHSAPAPKLFLDPRTGQILSSDTD